MSKAKKLTNMEVMVRAIFTEEALAAMGLPEAHLHYDGDIQAVVLNARSKAHTLLYRLDLKDLPESLKDLAAQVDSIITQLVDRAKVLPDVPPRDRARVVAPGLIQLPVSQR